MLCKEFISEGFRFISSDHYLTHATMPSIDELKQIFDQELEEDGIDFRKRAYLKLTWNKTNSAVSVATNQNYYQTFTSNKADGGKTRKFKIINSKILELPIIKNIINKNIEMIRTYPKLQKEEILTVGLHFIRYQTYETKASYSSPAWLHKDDEPLVFIHLVNLTNTALGGDNIIASSSNKTVTHVLRLENVMDTLVLNKNVYHAVTPLGSRNGLAFRDIILFTVEPSYTQ